MIRQQRDRSLEVLLGLSVVAGLQVGLSQKIAAFAGRFRQADGLLEDMDRLVSPAQIHEGSTYLVQDLWVRRAALERFLTKTNCFLGLTFFVSHSRQYLVGVRLARAQLETLMQVLGSFLGSAGVVIS